LNIGVQLQSKAVCIPRELTEAIWKNWLASYLFEGRLYLIVLNIYREGLLSFLVDKCCDGSNGLSWPARNSEGIEVEVILS